MGQSLLKELPRHIVSVAPSRGDQHPGRPVPGLAGIPGELRPQGRVLRPQKEFRRLAALVQPGLGEDIVIDQQVCRKIPAAHVVQIPHGQALPHPVKIGCRDEVTVRQEETAACQQLLQRLKLPLHAPVVRVQDPERLPPGLKQPRRVFVRRQEAYLLPLPLQGIRDGQAAHHMAAPDGFVGIRPNPDHCSSSWNRLLKSSHTR